MRAVFMFSACPFDVLTKTQQPVPVANMTVGLAAAVHAWASAPPPFPPCPATLVPSRSPTSMASHNTTCLHTCQNTVGTPGRILSFLPSSPRVMPTLLETTRIQLACYLMHNIAHLDSTYYENKNKISFVCINAILERSVFIHQEKKKRVKF